MSKLNQNIFLRRRWISLWSTLHIWWKVGKKQIVFFPPRQTYLFNQPTAFPLVHTFACLTFTLRVDCTTKVFKLNNFILHTLIENMSMKCQTTFNNWYKNSRFGLVTICSIFLATMSYLHFLNWANMKWKKTLSA